MEKMKHQDGFKLSEEETAKIEEFVSWFVDNGFHGIMLIHKGDVGVSFINEKDADEIRHDFINALGHICNESPDSAVALMKGMEMAIDQIKG